MRLGGRCFLREVETGRAKGYRIDVRDERNVLLRVVTQGEGYRAAELCEEVAIVGSVTRLAG